MQIQSAPPVFGKLPASLRRNTRRVLLETLPCRVRDESEGREALHSIRRKGLQMSIATSKSFSKAIAILVISVLMPWGALAHAAKKARTADVVVMRPTELPPAAQTPGQAMYLRAVGFSRYLYIEQESGKRLAVFDVSRPARIKTVAEIDLNTPSFEFLQAVTDNLVLVRITGPKTSMRLGVLDLQHPKKPILRALGDAEFVPVPSEASGPLQQPAAGIEIRDIQQVITDKELGSTFVLSAEGLWIIRHPAIEKDFELKELQFFAG